jgi:hypothetical protein
MTEHAGKNERHLKSIVPGMLRVCVDDVAYRFAIFLQ